MLRSKASESGGPSAGAARRWRVAAGLLVMAALTYLFLWRFWASAPEDRATFPEKSDTTEVFFPPRQYAARTWASGTMPLWNPHVYAGYPQYADPQAATFYPVALALGWAAGRGFSLETVALNVALHFFLAGAFSFLFFERLLRRLLPAVLGAGIFEFGGYLTGFVPLQLSELEAAVWLPATLLVLTWAVDRRSRPGLALAGVVFGLVFLAGRPQSYLSIAPLCLGWLVYYGRSRAAGWRTVAGWAALFLAFGLGSASVQWLPTLQLTRLSTRAHLTYAAVSEGGFALEELLALLGNGLVASTPMFVTLYYGTLTLALAALAVARRRGLFWASVAGLYLLGALGDQLIAFDALYLVERLGFPGYLRNVERLALGIGFCLAALGAIGLDQLNREKATVPKALLASAAGVLAAIAAAIWLQAQWRPAPEQMLPAIRGGVSAAVGFSLAALALWISGPRKAVAQAALVGLVLLDLMTANRGRFYVINQAPVAEEVAHMAAAPPGWSSPYRVAADQLTAQDFGSELGLDNIGGLPPLKLRAYDRLLSSVDQYRRNILLNVEVVATSGEFDDPAYALASSWRDFHYYHFLHAHERAYLVPNVQWAAGEDEAALLLAAPGFDHWNSAVVMGDGERRMGPALTPEEGAAVTSMSPNTVEVAVSTQAERLLVLAQTDYPGWTATVDGRPAAIVKTNLALQGVWVPAGAQRVVFRFAPPLFTIGLVISGGTWLGAGLWLWLGSRRRPVQRATTASSG